MDPQPANWHDSLEHAALSDVGLRRANNQDSMATMVAPSSAAWEQRGHLFMVADGMGAHAAGELASKLAADTIPLVYQKLMDRPPPQAILAAVQEANKLIHGRGQSSLDFKGMGTTCTVLVLLPQGALVAHVGDSRAYRLRGNRLEQLTFDHSLVWEMRASGQIQGKVPEYIPKNVITRSLGPNPSVQVDLEGPFPLAVGDTFLLCSDGLSGPVKDEEIGTLMACLPPADAVRALVDLACLRGGPDNITVVVARVAGPDIAVEGGNNKRSGSSTVKAGPVHPAVWTLLGVFALIGISLLPFGISRLPDTGLIYASLACLLMAAVAGGVAAFQRHHGRITALGGDGQRMGRGPYTATNASPTPELTGKLADIARDLRDAATKEGWAVDWHHFNGQVAGAVAATQSGDLVHAVRQYGQAISFMIAELKRAGRVGGGS
jgi:PPM family protein phosphatase